MINICYILRMIGFGGTERQVVELCRGLDKTKFSVTVVLFFHTEGYLEDLEAAGVRVVILARRDNYKWAVLPRLIRFLRREEFDIIQTFLPIANFAGGLACRFFHRRAKVICSLRNADPFSLKNPFCLMDLAAFHLFCHRVTANSQTGGRWAVSKYKIPPGKLKVIRNGRDFEPFSKNLQSPSLKEDLQIPEDSFVILTVGRVSRQKGQRYLVQAMDELKRRAAKNMILLIVGKAEEEYRPLKSLIASYGLENHVKLLGVRRDIPDLLRISDLFVLPSLWEGLANVLLEAMCVKVPVLATDIEPNREIIENNKTGILVPPKNPQALAQAILAVMTDKEKAVRLAAAANQFVRENFSLSRLVKEHEDFYIEIIYGHRDTTSHVTSNPPTFPPPQSGEK